MLALHYQNDVLHADGKIRVGLREGDPLRERVTLAAEKLLRGARAAGLTIVHVRIAFRPDYADLISNCTIFRETARIGAVRDGTWGAEFLSGLAPDADNPREFVVCHTRTSAFIGTPLEQLLAIAGTRRLVVAGVATHSTVEATVRHASDLGYHAMVAADACAAADSAVHDASLTSMRLIAEVADVSRALAWAVAGDTP